MKKNILRVPEIIFKKVEKIESNEIAAVYAKTLTKSDIESQKYDHLCIKIENGKFIIPSEIMPNSDQGKYSEWNSTGREIKRKDLPKEKFYNYVESPNWGDTSNGTHTVALPGKRYPIDFIPPRLSKIKIEAIKVGSEECFLKFTVLEVLNKKDQNFEDRLLFCLNILQENIGGFDVEKSGKSVEDYIKTNKISWEILPPGKRDEFLARVFNGKKYTEEKKKVVENRYDFFEKLNPKEIIVGNSGFNRYFGAKLENDLVVFENNDYGNALYMMYENWEELSKKSRLDLLSGRYSKDFDRIIHKNGWKNKVRKMVSDRRKNKRRSQ